MFLNVMFMRKKIVAGNWKMNQDAVSGPDLAKEISILAESHKLCKTDKVEIVICPPFIQLTECRNQLSSGSGVKIGAQNCHFEDKGAYTGEISPLMLISANIEYVIIGHSERRAYFKEDNVFLKKKVAAALKHGLKPIFCCGEVISERESGRHFEVVKNQLFESLFMLEREEFEKVVIAYEPVWAIGTGVVATPEQAQEMHSYIRGLIKESYDEEIAENTIILYGGSCNSSNASVLFANKDVDGGLIGGASLKADEFIKIIQAVLN